MGQFEYEIGDEVVDAMLGEGIVIGSAAYHAVLFPNGEEWRIREDYLVPAYEAAIGVGDRVEYRNPFFTGSELATVYHTDNYSIGVEFDNKRLPDGHYATEFFTKVGA